MTKTVGGEQLNSIHPLTYASQDNTYQMYNYEQKKLGTHKKFI